MKKYMLIFGGIFCAMLAFWAYQISGKTRIALSELSQIDNEIASEKERIEVLRAEWAILNRPERLRFLVEQNQARLGLVQITAVNYGDAMDVPETPKSDISEGFDGDVIDAILLDLINAGEIETQ